MTETDRARKPVDLLGFYLGLEKIDHHEDIVVK
jgi:hypothetical protein